MSQTPSQNGRPRPSLLCLGLVLALAAAVPGATARAQPPGPEVFAKTPTTPAELWDAIDYLMRTGQGSQAVPYLKKFSESTIDDVTLLNLRDRYGPGSFLRLQDHQETRPFAEPLVNKLAEASRRHSTQPERLARYIALLTKSQEEQTYAVERLRESGPYAVPAIVQEIEKPSAGAAGRATIVRNLGRLDHSAVPPLIATLDAAKSKPRLAADAADALGRIGDLRAVPALTAAAVASDGAVREAAHRAIERLTGRPFSAQPKAPVRLLTDEARRYHTHKIVFPGDAVTIWVWDDASQAPVARTISRSDAEGFLGLKMARAALAAEPTDHTIQAVFLSIALEKAIEKTGFDNFPSGDPSNTFATAVSAGPRVLTEVLRTAIADGKQDLAAAAASALGQVTDANAMAVSGQVNPLVAALSAPGRRTRFAAAKALVALDPRKPFAGSSRVVPVLAQFLAGQALPRAVVIDGNPTRGSQLIGHLKALGYDPILSLTGDDGFRAASNSADVELVLIDHHMVQGDWRLHDTLSNLRADARTAGLPIYVVGTLAREPDLMVLLTERFPGVKFMVTPDSPKTLDTMLAFGGSRLQPLSAEERSAYAREAADLLAQIAARPGSPLERDLVNVEPALTLALNSPNTSLPASAALGDVPNPDAQRGLADILIDPAKPAELRASAAAQLSKSVQRFGPLVTSDQETALLEAFDREPDAALRTALGTVIGALRPKAAPTGARLRRLDASPAAPPPPAAAGNAPATPPETTPGAETKPAEPKS